MHIPAGVRYEADGEIRPELEVEVNCFNIRKLRLYNKDKSPFVNNRLPKMDSKNTMEG